MARRLLLRRPSLTASASVVGADDSKLKSRLNSSWQERAWEYYDALGEIKQASQYYSKTLAKVDMIVQQLDPADGSWNETQDPDAVDALARLQLSPKKRATYGRLAFLVGEAYLACFFGTPADGEPVAECWEVCSTDELSYKDGKYFRKNSQGATAEEYDEVPEGEDPAPGQCMAFRFWTEHPRYSGEPDSSVRGILDICEQLMALEQAIRAQARSRAANAGILLVNELLSQPSVDVRDDDEDAQTDTFMADLGEHLMTPISDEGSASAVVPMVVRVPDVNNGMKHIQLGSSELYKETALRMECIGRMAIGLDMPPSVLTGLEDANHWSGWLVDENSFKDHLEPFCDEFCADLTEAYFWPTLRRGGKEGYDQFRIYYDPAKVVSHPNKAQDAKDDHDRYVISDKALRTATGFTERDAPTAAEIVARVARAAKGAPTPSGAVVGPENGVQPGAPESASVEQRLAAQRMLDWAELCVMRSREIAGSRLRSKIKEPAAIAKIRNAPNRQVAAIVGAEKLRGSDPDALVAGGGDIFAAHLSGKGVEPSVARHLVRICEEHAARTLYDEAPELTGDIIGLCAMAGLRITAEPIAA